MTNNKKRITKIKSSPLDEEWRSEVIKLIDKAKKEIVIIGDF